MTLTHLPQYSDASNYDAKSKVNDQNLPPVDHTIDWDNPSLASAVCDVAGITQTVPRFRCRLTLAASTGALALISWKAVWGNATITPPVLARSTTGVFTITLPTTVADEYDASLGISNPISVNLESGVANMEAAVAACLNVSCSSNVITLRGFNPSTLAASDFVGNTVHVVCW